MAAARENANAPRKGKARSLAKADPPVQQEPVGRIKRYDKHIAEARRAHVEAQAEVNRLDIELDDLNQRIVDLLEQRSDAAAVQTLAAHTINNAHKIIEAEHTPQITERPADGTKA